MVRTGKFGLVVATVVAACCGSSLARPPVGTEFTYQGQLLKNGVALNTPADLKFSLWDGSGPTATQIGTFLFVPFVPINQGRFECAVDFGQSPYTTNEERWLQVEVRNPAGSGGAFSLMGDRQKLTATPFSLATRGINVDTAGNVGIGTTSLVPDQKLTLINNVPNAGVATIGNDAAISFGGVYFSQAGAVKGWVGATGGGAWCGGDTMQLAGTETTDLVFLTGCPERMRIRADTGNVGIGTSEPNRPLHVRGPGGVIQVERNSPDPSITIARFSDGGDFSPATEWKRFAIATSGTGRNNGKLLFNDDQRDSGGNGLINTRMVIDNDGNVGIGTVTPDADAKIHVRNMANARCTLRIDSGATEGNYSVVGFADRGAQIWSCGLRPDGSFGIDRDGFNTFLQINAAGRIGLCGTAPTANRLTVNGGAFCNGFQWVDVCDANAKEGFEEVDPESILEKVAELPVTTWHYKGQESTHIGPTAQDFHRVFGFGENDTSIAAVNTNGVSLAAIQGLIRKAAAKDEEIQDLKARLEKLEALLAERADATASK